MFTGIITDMGTIRAVSRTGDTRFAISTNYNTDTVAIGGSIACSGVCLTVIGTGPDWFAVSVSKETLSRTTLGEWEVGTNVNLERSLRIGDELGGHLVSGHVDGVGKVMATAAVGDSRRVVFETPSDLMPLIAVKGSVTIDGVSLTVNEIAGNTFGVNLIPHTCEVTTFGNLRAGDSVNLEIDMIARYVARLLHKD
ncbi:MAG: riboflavin synthase [Rhodospirillales bacterium]|nr:riboflavin synthase [Rhodospirillales bacterium]